MPLHPMVVHFPIVFAVLIPIAMATAIIFDKKIKNRKAVWGAIVAFSAVLALSAFVTMKLGAMEEEIVEKVVSESLIEKHEELAELFSWSTIILFVMASLAFYRDQIVFKGLALAASLAIFGMLAQTADSGGELVYKHNAGAAYAIAKAGGVNDRSPLSAYRGGEDGHDDDD
ncbi:hypothetical protein MNBD_NITROSPINAE02-1718 [hydrothermal vent metagenome]|uniref:DUF2231 domain-containing protein n=1 Tax=hydrothermal vent metagenome TaxID=652676 RepID=A0A3B1BWN6_9ZZZZ